MRSRRKPTHPNPDQLRLFDVSSGADETAPPHSRGRASARSATNTAPRTRISRPTMAVSAEIYRLNDLMRLFGYADRNSFRTWRRRVEEQGFPTPLPGCVRPLKWDRSQVDAWRSGKDFQRTRSSVESLGSQCPADVIALAREKLRSKAMSRTSGAV